MITREEAVEFMVANGENEYGMEVILEDIADQMNLLTIDRFKGICEDYWTR